MYGLGDEIAGQAEEISKLKKKISTLKKLLRLCQMYIESKNQDPLAKALLIERIGSLAGKD